MGNEFGHPEWIDFPRYDNGWSFKYAKRQWSLADNGYLKYHWLGDFDKAMIDFVKKTRLLASNPAWLLEADEENKTIIFEKNNFIFVFNWGQKSLPDYEVKVKQTGDYKIVLSTDSQCFGGFGNVDEKAVFPSEKREDGVFMKVYNVARTAVVYSVDN